MAGQIDERGIDVTVEHYTPTHGLDLQPYLDRRDLMGAHHLARYLWAAECIADLAGIQTLLDIACGSGYGSFLLAQRFPEIQVLGVDYAPGAVSRATQRYNLPNLTFALGDGTRWSETIGDSIFDCIVSFDTIEHIAHREILMESIVEHLSPAGTLLLSTPCGGSNVLRPRWEEHEIEFSAASLYDFLSRYFRTILRPDANTLPHVDIFHRVRDAGIEYLLLLNPVLCKEPIRVSNPYR